jgi:hypothetical protein
MNKLDLNVPAADCFMAIFGLERIGSPQKERRNLVSNKKDKKQRRKQHIKDWVEFLKEDYDFDWAYIVRMLIFKLERTRKSITANGILCKKQMSEINDQISSCTKLLQNVLDDKYYDKYESELTKKFGKLKQKHIDKPDNTIEVIFYRTRETEANKNEVKKLTKRSFELADKDKQRDLDAALAILSKYLFWWWD